MNAKWRSF